MSKLIKLGLLAGLFYAAVFVANYLEANANIINFKRDVDTALKDTQNSKTAIDSIMLYAERMNITIPNGDVFVEYKLSKDSQRPEAVKVNAYAEMPYEAKVNNFYKIKSSFYTEIDYYEHSRDSISRSDAELP